MGVFGLGQVVLQAVDYSWESGCSADGVWPVGVGLSWLLSSYQVGTGEIRCNLALKPTGSPPLGGSTPPQSRPHRYICSCTILLSL